MWGVSVCSNCFLKHAKKVKNIPARFIQQSGSLSNCVPEDHMYTKTYPRVLIMKGKKYLEKFFEKYR